LVFGRFVIPFVILMPRPWRRSPMILTFVAIWLLAFHVLDMYWMVRPTVAGGQVVATWIDIVAVLGPLGIFFGLLGLRIAKNPLIPVNDPRLDEGIAHKNYV